MEKIKIQGKDYIQVNQRIIEFRKLYPAGSILTEIVSHENDMILIKASCINDGQILSNGHAYEKNGTHFLTKLAI